MRCTGSELHCFPPEKRLAVIDISRLIVYFEPVHVNIAFSENRKNTEDESGC
jgi:hypothetical protein